MADYNSAYTGPEVDAALAKTTEIGEFKELYNGAAKLSWLVDDAPVNPKTGDRTGLYYITYKGSASSGDFYCTTMMHIPDENLNAQGAGPVAFWADGGQADMVNFDYTTRLITAIHTNQSTAGETNMYIYKVYRFQPIT